MLKILAVSFLFLLSGCAAPVIITGLGVASVATNEATGKGIADHAVSTVKNQDCKLARVLKDQAVCQEETPEIRVTVTTTGVTPTSVAEIQSRYTK